MTIENDGIFNDKCIRADYEQTTALKWHSLPGGALRDKPTVSWEITNPKLFRSAASRDGRIYCFEDELLGYLALPGFNAAFSPPDQTPEKTRRQNMINYFLRVSQETGKQIDAYRSSRLYPKEVFYLRMTPTMTLHTRKEKMLALAAVAGQTLSTDSNVSQIWLGGSLTQNTDHPFDVDLLVVTSQIERPTYSRYIEDEGPLGATPFATCRGREGNPLDYLWADTVHNLQRQADTFGIFLDCMLLPPDRFQSPDCCPNHERVVRDFKRGKLLFKRTIVDP